MCPLYGEGKVKAVFPAFNQFSPVQFSPILCNFTIPLDTSSLKMYINLNKDNKLELRILQRQHNKAENGMKGVS